MFLNWATVGGTPGMLHHMKSQKHQLLPLLPSVLDHHSKQNKVISIVSEVLDCWGAIEQILWNERRKFWCFSPRWWEVSDPLHTNSIHRLCTEPYHNPMRKSWLFLSWLVGQLKVENSCLFFCCFTKKAALYRKSSKSFTYYCVYFNCNNCR